MRASWGFCFRTWPFCHFTAASRPRVCHCISLPIPACKTPAKPLQFPLTKALTKLCAVPLDHMTNLASQPATKKTKITNMHRSIRRSPSRDSWRPFAAFGSRSSGKTSGGADADADADDGPKVEGR